MYGHNGNNVTAGQQDYAERMNQIENQREAYYKLAGVAPGLPTMKGSYADPEVTGKGYNVVIKELGDHRVPENWVQHPVINTEAGSNPGAPLAWGSPENPDDVVAGYGYVAADTSEVEETFYYHSDHLGSTAYITDQKANVTQYDAYLPYGELLVDEHSSSTEMPYKFNGKELDEETGLYYYGARYMNPITSMWYGVDPLAEKYPNVSAFVYCMGNPVKLVDVDGKDWYKNKNGIILWDKKISSRGDVNEKKGEKYLGPSYYDKKTRMSYRKDGSVMCPDEWSGVQRMQLQRQVSISKENKLGNEQSGCLLTDDRMLVFADDRNDSHNSYLPLKSKLTNNVFIDGMGNKYKVAAHIHTHPGKKSDAFSPQDSKMAWARPNLPFLELHADGNVYYTIMPAFYDKKDRHWNYDTLCKVSDILKGQTVLLQYARQIRNKLSIRQ